MKRKFGAGGGEETGDFDYQAKLAAIRNNPDKTRANIGGRVVWVDACQWQRGHRCRMPSTSRNGGLCRWHHDCLDHPASSEDYSEFLKWREKEITCTYHPDFISLAEKKFPDEISPPAISLASGGDPVKTWKLVRGGADQE